MVARLSGVFARKGGGLVVLTAGLFFTFTDFGTAHGQTFSRSQDRVIRDFGQPGVEDFAAYLRMSGFPERDRTDDSSSLAPEKLIQAIKEKLNGRIQQSEEAILLLQLAEAYGRAADAENAKLVADYSKEYRSWLLASEQGKQPAFSSDGPQKHLLDQVKTYRTLFKKYPKIEKRPGVVFGLALALARAGSTNALLYLDKLEKDFPNTDFAVAAQLLRAELKFYGGKFAEARSIFASQQNSKNQVVAPFAVYKTGWIDAHTGTSAKQKASGYEKLQKTALLAGKNASARFLAGEASNDLIWFWSERFDAKRASAFFTGKRREGYYETLERIAWKLELSKEEQRAGTIYSGIATKAPKRLRAPLSNRKLMAIQLSANNLDGVVRTLERMQNQYGPKGVWTTAHRNNKDALAAVQKHLKEDSFMAAERMLDQIKAGTKTAIEPGLRATELFLGAYAKGDEAYHLRYRYAAALETASRPMDAAIAYLAVVKSEEPAGRYRDISARKMLTVQQRYVQTLTSRQLPAPGSLSKKMSIPAPHQLLVEIIDTFAEIFPEDEALPAHLLTAARIECDFGHYDTANQRFDKIIRTYASGPEASAALQYVLGTHTRQRDWLRLISVSRSYLDLDELIAVQDNIAQLRSALRTGMWEKASDELKKNNTLAAAKSFRDFQKEFPQDPEADKALSLAVRIYVATGKGPEATMTGMLLTTTYVQSQYRADTMIAVAEVLEQMLDFTGAAAVLESFTTAYQRDNRVPSALNRAIRYRLDSEDRSRAEALLDLLTKRFPGSDEAKSSQLRFATHLESSQELVAAAGAWTRYGALAAASAPDEALYAQAKSASLLHQIIEGRPGAEKSMIRLRDQLTQLPKERAQKARTVVATYFMLPFNEKVLKVSGLDIDYSSKKDYAKSTEIFRNMLAELERDQKVIERIGSDEVTPASYFKLAGCYEMAITAYQGFTNEFEFSASEVHEIDSNKEKIIFELRKSVISNLEASYNTAGGSSPYNSWRVLTQKKLAKLLPEKYVDTTETVLIPQYTEVKFSSHGKGH